MRRLATGSMAIPTSPSPSSMMARSSSSDIRGTRTCDRARSIDSCSLMSELTVSPTPTSTSVAGTE